jgi:hypothetical protein
LHAKSDQVALHLSSKGVKVALWNSNRF